MASRLDKLLALGLILANEPICVEAKTHGKDFCLAIGSIESCSTQQAILKLEENFPYPGFTAKDDIESYSSMTDDNKVNNLVAKILEFLQEDYKDDVEGVSYAAKSGATEESQVAHILGELLVNVEKQREKLTQATKTTKSVDKTETADWYQTKAGGTTIGDYAITVADKIVAVRAGLLRGSAFVTGSADVCLEKQFQTVATSAIGYPTDKTNDKQKLVHILRELRQKVETQRTALTGKSKESAWYKSNKDAITDADKIIVVREGLLHGTTQVTDSDKVCLEAQFTTAWKPQKVTPAELYATTKPATSFFEKIEKLRDWLTKQLQTAEHQHEQLAYKALPSPLGSVGSFTIAVRTSLFTELKKGTPDWTFTTPLDLTWSDKTDLAPVLALVKRKYEEQCTHLVVVPQAADAFSAIIAMRNLLRDKETKLHEKYTAYTSKAEARDLSETYGTRILSIQAKLVLELKKVYKALTKTEYSSNLGGDVETIQRAILTHKIEQIAGAGTGSGAGSGVPTTIIAGLEKLYSTNDVLQFHPTGHAMVQNAVKKQTNLQQQQQQQEANLQQQQQQKEAAKAEEEAAIGVGVGIGFGVTAVAAFIGLLAGFFCCKDEVSTGANVATEAGKNSGKFKNKMLNGQAARSRTSNAGQVDVPITGYFATTAEGATAERQQDAMAVVGTVGDIAAIAAGVFLLSGALLVWCRRRARGSRRDNFAGQQTRPSFAPGQRRPNFVRQRQQVW